MNVENLVRRWGLKAALSVLAGVVDAAIYYILFAILIPTVVEELYVQLAGMPPDIGETYRSPILIAGITSVFIVSRVLEGTLFSPVFRAAGILLALTLAVGSLGGSLTISVEGLEVSEGVYLDFKLDITPLYLAILFFIVFPGIVASFIEYFLWEAGK